MSKKERQCAMEGCKKRLWVCYDCYFKNFKDQLLWGTLNQIEVLLHIFVNEKIKKLKEEMNNNDR